METEKMEGRKLPRNIRRDFPKTEGPLSSD